MKILVTGAAGFIGFHTSKALLERGDEVVGLDQINDYYDINLKYGRLETLGISRKSIKDEQINFSEKNPNFKFIKTDLENYDRIRKLFEDEKFDRVIHLAAQAGVRYSIENPFAYINSNLVGFESILEACRHNNIEHLVYASSSSVYGNSDKVPFSTKDPVDHPVSLYAATKKSNELMAHTYSHLYDLPTTGLRFFTVYGPWGRPDMAYFKFTNLIREGKPIKIYNHGDMRRDFTYIDDIVNAMLMIIKKAPIKDDSIKNISPANSKAPYRVYNIGRGAPVVLLEFVEILENALGIQAKKELVPMQPGDVYQTYADVTGLQRDFGYKPNISFEDGIAKFAKWYKQYYGWQV